MNERQHITWRHAHYVVSLRAGADPGFQVRVRRTLKKLRRAEGGAKIVGVFRVKKHDFTPKNLIFSNFRGGARRVRPPLDPPLQSIVINLLILIQPLSFV